MQLLLLGRIIFTQWGVIEVDSLELEIQLLTSNPLQYL